MILQHRRTLWDAHGDPVLVDFKWKLEGGTGSWNPAHRGLPMVEFHGKASNDDAKNFCDGYGLHRSFTASIRLYTEAHAARCQCWHALWISRGAKRDFEFSQADLQPYTEPDSVRELEATANDKTLRRLLQWRHVQPKRR